MTRHEFLAQQEKEIHEYLKSKGIYSDVYSHNQIPVVSVEISWGDWKHEHLYCDHLMEQKGFKKVGTQVTAEDGSDCYSGIHNYIMSDDMVAGFRSFNE